MLYFLLPCILCFAFGYLSCYLWLNEERDEIKENREHIERLVETFNKMQNERKQNYSIGERWPNP
jgi:hypothetical protein